MMWFLRSLFPSFVCIVNSLTCNSNLSVTLHVAYRYKQAPATTIHCRSDQTPTKRRPNPLASICQTKPSTSWQRNPKDPSPTPDFEDGRGRAVLKSSFDAFHAPSQEALRSIAPRISSASWPPGGCTTALSPSFTVVGNSLSHPKRGCWIRCRYVGSLKERPSSSSLVWEGPVHRTTGMKSRFIDGWIITIGVVGGVFMVISGHHSGMKVWGGRPGIVLLFRR